VVNALLAERIDDEPFLRLIKKWLKAGVLDTNGKVPRPESGTPARWHRLVGVGECVPALCVRICGSRKYFDEVVKARRFCIVMPMTLSAVLDEQKKQSGFTTSWKNGYGSSDWNWRKTKHR
jgi:hypothetical protein